MWNIFQPIYSTDVRRKSSVFSRIVLAGGSSISFLSTFYPEWIASRALLQDEVETWRSFARHEIETGTPFAPKF
ncbi:MAG: hypothetical protein A2Z16_11475 [Chloroflexi bacterium RBG_16_54_18]|nr:MAG: hypothetical protein A2Z16_11475 [Chloroflexi bacterium RBG_16_54_18]